jgi:hypothetical protein
MLFRLSALLLLAGAVFSSADVYFEEEIVNPGFGQKKAGARQTTNKVYIKGARQKVETQIQTSKETAQALKKQGQALLSSTILRLDRAEVYQIDLEAQTFVQRKMPPPAPKAAGKKVAASPSNPQVGFAFKETGDSTRIAGIPCKRVVAQMRARYQDPKSGKPLRENRYTYDAWIARNFPGYQEIRAFRTMQDTSTSYPSLISGGLEQMKEAVQEDYAELATRLEELEGFPLRSTLTASVLRADTQKETEVFRLERQIKVLIYSSLPDSVFVLPKTLTKVTQ